jgi:hypothetical protein
VGILLGPQQPFGDWAAAVRKLWQDQRQYAELSAAAAIHAERREMTLDFQWPLWERAMSEVSGLIRSRGISMLWKAPHEAQDGPNRQSLANARSRCACRTRSKGGAGKICKRRAVIVVLTVVRTDPSSRHSNLKDGWT